MTVKSQDGSGRLQQQDCSKHPAHAHVFGATGARESARRQDCAAGLVPSLPFPQGLQGSEQ